MPVLFVLCEADAKQTRTKSVGDAVKEFGETLVVSERSYIVKTDRHADEVFAHLRKKTGAGKLWVFTVPEPYTGLAPASVKEWLEHVSTAT